MKVKLSSLLKVCWAAGLSNCVQSRFLSMGGIMLIAPPGALKTSILNLVSQQHTSIGLSDVNVQTLMQMRPSMITGKISTLIVYDFQKIYERAQSTSSNLVAAIRAMTDEGFGSASFENQMLTVTKARCCLLAATTEAHQQARWNEWTSTGFARRLLFSRFHLASSDQIIDSILADDPLVFDFSPPKFPIGQKLEMFVDRKLDDFFMSSLAQQPSAEGVGLILLKKIYTVLLWMECQRFEQFTAAQESAMETMVDFASTLKTSAILQIDALQSTERKIDYNEHSKKSTSPVGEIQAGKIGERPVKRSAAAILSYRG